MGTFGSLLPVVKRVAAGPFETVTRGAVVAHLLKYRTVSKLCRTSAMCGIVAGRQCQACEHRKVECPHNRKAAQTSITLACHSLASRPFCRSLLIYLKGRGTEPGRESSYTHRLCPQSSQQSRAGPACSQELETAVRCPARVAGARYLSAHLRSSRLKEHAGPLLSQAAAQPSSRKGCPGLTGLLCLSQIAVFCVKEFLIGLRCEKLPSCFYFIYTCAHTHTE